MSAATVDPAPGDAPPVGSAAPDPLRPLTAPRPAEAPRPTDASSTVEARRPTDAPRPVDAVVIGAGQAGLAASWHLRRSGIDHVVLDAGDGPGGAWAHRWPTLTMATVNGVHDLPGQSLDEDGAPDPSAPASRVVTGYFASYERRWQLPVERPVLVRSVARDGARLLVTATDGRAWRTRVVLNATGTWSRPFWPHYPGAQLFRGRQLHTADYTGPGPLAGRRVVVVGGGISAVQLLAEVSVVAATTWVTRTPPRWREEGDAFDQDAARAAVARIADRVRAGRPPGSIVSATGLVMTPQLQDAAARGVLRRLPVFDRITATGVAWDDGPPPSRGEAPDASARRELAGTELPADVLLWCTGFRPVISHLAPLKLRGPDGGIAVDGTRAVRETRLHLLGYGPSASTVGATRAAREAVREVREMLGR